MGDGAGRYFDIDPVVFRIVLAVLALTGGVGLIAYGLAWLLVPQEGEEKSEAHRLLSGRIEGPALTAVLVALVGCGLFLSMPGNPGNQAFSLALLAVLAGAVYWSQQHRRAQRHGASAAAPPGAAADAPPAAQPPPSPSTALWWREPITKDTAVGTGGYLWGPDDGPYQETHRQAWRERRRAARGREGSRLGILVFFLAATAAATGTAVSWRSQPLGTSLEIGFGCALGVFGLGYVVSTWFGRLRGGTVVAAVLATVLLVGAAALPKSIGTEWARTTWRPATVAELKSSYELGAGEAGLDLTTLDLNGKTVSTHADIGAGRMDVTVPADATVRLRLRVGLGDVRLPANADKDIDVRPGLDRTTTLAPANGAESTGTIKLDLDVGLGQVRVIR